MVEITIYKGYKDGKEVYAVGRECGQDDYKTSSICPINPTSEVLKEYERQRNVYNNTRRKAGKENCEVDTNRPNNSSLSSIERNRPKKV